MVVLYKLECAMCGDMPAYECGGEFKFTNGLDWEDIEEWRCWWLNGADGASVWGKPA